MAAQVCSKGSISAPTLLSWLLTAMLIRTCHSVHTDSKTRAQLALVRELLYADDSAIVANNFDNVQTIIDKDAEAASCYGLSIYLTKPILLDQPPMVEPDPGHVFVSSQPLQSFHNFTYLGSTLLMMRRIKHV